MASLPGGAYAPPGSSFRIYGLSFVSLNVIVEEQEFAESKGNGSPGARNASSQGSSRSVDEGDSFMNIPEGFYDGLRIR